MQDEYKENKAHYGQNVETKDKDLESRQRKMTIIYKWVMIGTMADFSSEAVEARRR